MNKTFWSTLTTGLTGLLVLGTTGTSPAAVINFTGGTVHLLDGTTATTDGIQTFQNVDYYVEDGFKLDFLGPTGNPFSYIVGNYYGADLTGSPNDVIHAHWDTGNYGDLTEIRVTKEDGTPFDLNYFILTSNTELGGGPASGNEQVYLNSSNGFSQLLPPENWGWGGSNPQRFLDSNFEGIEWFSFTVANAVDCFGMDNFYIDEPPPTVPEPSTLGLLGSSLFVLAGVSRKRKTL